MGSVGILENSTLICAPLVAQSVEQMVIDMKQAKAEGADVVEVRLDYIKNFQPRQDLEIILRNKPLPVIIVYRPKWEGGLYEGDEHTRVETLQLAKELGADYIDFELKVASDLMGELRKNRHSGSKIIVSCYVNSMASLEEDLSHLVASIQTTGANIIKLVANATSITEISRIFHLLSHCQVPLIAYSVGERGLISQILCRKFGGFLTYGSIEGNSVPGLPTLDSLRQAYKVEYVNEETKVFGLISKPVGHSKGPLLHNPTFRHVNYNGIYVPMFVDDLRDFFSVYSTADFAGFSVGFPYKEAIFGFCDEVHPLAQAIGAVNTIVRRPSDGPKLKKSTLTISLVPEDVGKPTVRLQKAAVQDGTCSWENPIYETVKLIREQKTGKLHEKIYHFIVSTGSSKSGYVGEASIDLADFVAETKPLTVSLPLKFANSGAVLHVTIQKMEEANDQKDGEEHGAPFLSHDESLKNQPGNCSPDENLYNFAEDGYLNESASQIAEQNGIFRASTGSSATLASCWDINSIQSSQPDLGLRSSNIHKKGIANAITTRKHAHQRSNTYCSVDSASDGSLVDSTNSLEENLTREKLQDASDDSIGKLKTEIATLMRQAEVSEMELQSLRKQLVKERKQGENQSRQIISLKEEKDALEIECEQLNSLQKCIVEAEAPKRLHSEIIDTRVQLEEVRQELNYEKKISSDLQLQLQKTQDLNSELIYAVRDLEEMLEIKNRKISDISTSKMNGDKNPETLKELAEEHNDSKEVDLLKENIRDLNGEIDFYKKHKEELDMHMKQLTLDFELLKRENYDISLKLEQSQVQQQMTQNECSVSLATIKELESLIERLEEKIKKQAEDLSECLFSINELEGQVDGLEKELEKQAQAFEEDLNAMTFAKTEQEQRAIRAEEAMRKTKWNNAVTAERLQEDFRRLSVEMASKLDEHEKQAMKELTEANELRLQKRTLEELLQKSNEELRQIKDQNEVQKQDLLNQIHLNEKQIEKMSLELAQKSQQLEYAQKHERENHKAFSMEIQMLRVEVERLTKEKYNFYEQAETDKIKTSIGEKEMLMQSWNKERGDLEKKLALAKKEAEKIHEEFSSMRSLKDEKEIVNNNLLSEVEKLRAHHDELKHNLYKEELEKENLRKQIFQLKHQLVKKEEEITSIEKKLMNCNGESEERENGMKNLLLSKMSAAEGMSIQKEVSVVPHQRRVETHSEKELKVSTFYTKDECNCTNFSSEVALLKERNKCMDKELKEMQERYSEISLKFAEVEGERQQLVMAVRNLKNGKKN